MPPRPDALPRDADSRPDWSAFNLIGDSPPFRALLGLLHTWAAVEATVLLCGETGTGKELAARAIHYLSPRRGGPFVPINCGALPDSLIESELFGHVRGAFTDASREHRGVVAQADGGTLFLDEVDALSLRGQAALLRFVQDGSYRPLGSPRSAQASVRLVAATNADLGRLCDEGRFRRDLLYRLNLLSVTLPPLRDRPGDAALLASAFLARLAQQYGRPHCRIDEASLAALAHQPWPGNVRELEHVVHRAFLLATGPVVALALQDQIASARPAPPPATGLVCAAAPPVPYAQAKAQALEEFERGYVRQLLQEAQGNLSLAARLAGRERSGFGKLVRKHGLSGERVED